MKIARRSSELENSISFTNGKQELIVATIHDTAMTRAHTAIAFYNDVEEDDGPSAVIKVEGPQQMVHMLEQAIAALQGGREPITEELPRVVR